MSGEIAKKLGIKAGSRTILINAPADAVKAIDLPPLERETELSGSFDYIHFFVKTQADFNKTFPKLKAHLAPEGKLWVSWIKGGRQKTDLNLTSIIKLGYDHGLVESKVVSINATWSAIKFTHPKAGKVYKNSYGKLKS